MQGGSGAPQPQQPQAAPQTAAQRPDPTVPQPLAFAACGLQAVHDRDAAAKPAPRRRSGGSAASPTYAVVVVLTPSDAGIRFGRAVYYRSASTPQPGCAQLPRA